MNDNADHLYSGGLPAGYIQESRRPSLEAAVEWGIHRCASEEARTLYPRLLLLLSGLNAVVLPVERAREEPGRVDLRVTITLVEPNRSPCRVRFALIDAARRHLSPRGHHLIVVDATACLSAAWCESARIVGEMLAFLADLRPAEIASNEASR